MNLDPRLVVAINKMLAVADNDIELKYAVQKYSEILEQIKNESIPN